MRSDENVNKSLSLAWTVVTEIEINGTFPGFCCVNSTCKQSGDGTVLKKNKEKQIILIEIPFWPAPH